MGLREQQKDKLPPITVASLRQKTYLGRPTFCQAVKQINVNSFDLDTFFIHFPNLLAFLKEFYDLKCLRTIALSMTVFTKGNRESRLAGNGILWWIWIFLLHFNKKKTNHAQNLRMNLLLTLKIASLKISRNCFFPAQKVFQACFKTILKNGYQQPSLRKSLFGRWSMHVFYVIFRAWKGKRAFLSRKVNGSNVG